MQLMGFAGLNPSYALEMGRECVPKRAAGGKLKFDSRHDLLIALPRGPLSDWLRSGGLLSRCVTYAKRPGAVASLAGESRESGHRGFVVDLRDVMVRTTSAVVQHDRCRAGGGRRLDCDDEVADIGVLQVHSHAQVLDRRGVGHLELERHCP